MKRLTCFFLFMTAIVPFLTSCVDEEEYADNPRGNFEALWRMMDEHYCFFDLKGKEYGLDWDEVYSRYSVQMSDNLSEDQLFEILGNMLGELRDGHVNMYSAWDVARNWSWKEDYPSNYSDTLINKYLGTDYRIAAGMEYRVLDDNIGYIRCESFSSAAGEGNLDEIMLFLAPCNGLIIDLRNNSGGMLTASEKLAARFTNKEICVGYMQHKTGPGHNDFSQMEPIYLEPSNSIRWQKKVVILTNRRCYSATNDFVNAMRSIEDTEIIQLGDRTGGGSGLPFSSELPNGWSIRFSASPHFDKNKQPLEEGIAPDVAINMSKEDQLENKDTLIEKAFEILNE